MHPAERYVGLPHCPDTFDCADLVALVQRELFGREVRLPNGRARGAKGQVTVSHGVGAYATPTPTPRDGDLVLMFEETLRYPGHVGTWFEIDHEGWVLHSNRRNGCAVLHRVRDVAGFGAPIEGYYTWL